MTGVRVVPALVLAGIVISTLFVIPSYGLNLLPILYVDIQAMGWPGQFDVDFLGVLILSGFWLAWRHHFSPGGIALEVLGLFGGATVLALYLPIVSVRANGDVRELMLGKTRANG